MDTVNLIIICVTITINTIIIVSAINNIFDKK